MEYKVIHTPDFQKALDELINKFKLSESRMNEQIASKKRLLSIHPRHAFECCMLDEMREIWGTEFYLALHKRWAVIAYQISDSGDEAYTVELLSIRDFDRLPHHP